MSTNFHLVQPVACVSRGPKTGKFWRQVFLLLAPPQSWWRGWKEITLPFPWYSVSFILSPLLPWKICSLRKCWLLSHVQLFATPWSIAQQVPLSMEFSRQENWSGLPFPPPGHLPHPGIEPGSPALQTDSLPSEPPEKPGKLLQEMNWQTIHTEVYMVDRASLLTSPGVF